MRTHLSHRRGLTLLEIMLAVIVLSVVAAVTMAYVRQPADRVKREACSLQIKQLEVQVRQYEADYASLPSSNLVQLTAPRYVGKPLPLCPFDGRPYILDTRTGLILPHNH